MSRHPISLPAPETTDQRILYYGGAGAFLGNLALVAGLAVVGSAGELRLEYQVNYPVPLVPFAVYVFLGCAAVGAVVAVLYDRYRTVTPSLLSTLTYAVAVASTRWSTPRPRGGVTALEYVLLAWPLVLLVALLAGGLERTLR